MRFRIPNSADAALAAAFLACGFATASAQVAPPAGGDEIAQPLGGRTGDVERGRRVVVDREGAHCLLCHRLPIPEERFHGDLAPPLDGVGARLTPGQIRLRVVDASLVNAETIMPPYFRVEGLHRVAAQHRGRTVLTEQQIEDVVAYLSSLKD